MTEIEELRERVANLETEIGELGKAFSELRRAFDNTQRGLTASGSIDQDARSRELREMISPRK